MIYDAVILYFHVPETKPYMQPTKDFMAEISAHFEVKEIITRPGVDPSDMGQGLKDNWNKGKHIIVFGQDNFCHFSQLMNLYHCNEPVCAIPCISFPESTGLPYLCLNQISNGKMHHATSTEPYALDYVGTGICKISIDAQRRIGSIDKDVIHHQNFDTTISNRSKQAGIHKFHLHYPLHQHTKIGATYTPRV